MPYRFIYIGLALVGVAAIALGIVFAVEGDEPSLPEALESVSPLPGALVPLQTSIEIDLEVGYEAQVFVDGWPIDDVVFVAATGVVRWAPSATSPTVQEWTPGEHTIRVVWDTYVGLPDPGEYEWSFRVG